MYQNKIAGKNNAKKEEFENCKKTILKIYKKEPIKGVWCFTLEWISQNLNIDLKYQRIV